jgi:hypothetical protein
VSDVEAARLYVMDNLNKPGSDSSPQLWLRHGYITRLYREVEEGILCIAENALVETIPEEAKSLKLQGLECYVSFPYQREVYAYCKELLAKKYDHFLRPFFDVTACATKPEAPRLRYQLQQFMTCALYSVATTRNGTCLPSYDGEGKLGIVELDATALRSKASVFWENLSLECDSFLSGGGWCRKLPGKPA